MKEVFRNQGVFENFKQFALNQKELQKIKGGDGGDDDIGKPPGFGGG